MHYVPPLPSRSLVSIKLILLLINLWLKHDFFSSFRINCGWFGFKVKNIGSFYCSVWWINACYTQIAWRSTCMLGHCLPSRCNVSILEWWSPCILQPWRWVQPPAIHWKLMGCGILSLDLCLLCTIVCWTDALHASASTLVNLTPPSCFQLHSDHWEWYFDA